MANGKNTSIAERAVTVRDHFLTRKDSLQDVLPKGMDAAKFTAEVMNACKRQPKLFSCDVQSLYAAACTSAELGLSLNPVLGQAALIPYKTTAQFQPMYKGLVALAYRSGVVSYINGAIRHENDDWEYSQGAYPVLRHTPAEDDRGVKRGAYVVVRLKSEDVPIFHYMSRAEIEKHRDRYSMAWKKNMPTPWGKFHETDPSESDGMWLKTVFIQLSRWLPKTAESAPLERALEKDYEAEAMTIDIEGAEVEPEDDAPADPLDAAADELEKEADKAEGKDTAKEPEKAQEAPQDAQEAANDDTPADQYDELFSRAFEDKG